MNVLEHIYRAQASKHKQLAVLVDPDKTSFGKLSETVLLGQPDLWLIGGSFMTQGEMKESIGWIKSLSEKPVVIFPGSPAQIDPEADALLLLSLVSGRNPEYLIGKQVESAFQIKRSGLEIIPTAYLLVDGGKTTTAHYISNTQPIPSDKPELAAATALAAEQLGMRMAYLDAGSGAKLPIPTEMIAMVKAHIQLPVIVGGGITTAEQAVGAWKSGADVVVVGNALEANHRLLEVLLAAQKSV